MTKEERKEYRKIRKEKMKFGKAAKWLYAVFVLLLLGASAYLVKLTWDECAVYQKESAATRVNQAIEYVEGVTGLELKTNMVPVKSEEGRVTYRLYSEEGAVAEVDLTKTRSCGIVLSIYDEPLVRSLVSYNVLMPADAIIELKEGEVTLDSDLLVSDIEQTALNRFSIPAKSILNGMGISVPSYKWVKIDGVFDKSQISVIQNDNTLKLVEKNGNDLFAMPVPEDELNETLRKRAAYCAEKYSNFVSNDYPFYSLYQLICWNSPLPGRLLDVNLTWYGAHDKVEVKDMKVSDALKLTDNDYMLNVIFDYLSYYGSDITDEEIRLTIYRHNDYGTWNIAELTNNIQADWIKAYSIQ
jgi:hypothetical protein